MLLSFKESLDKLEKLTPDRLHKTCYRLRGELASAEWKMAVCLLASVRTKGFRKLGYGTISDYAERALQLSGKKTGMLLSTARALEHLPLLSQAFREGKIGWAKLREIKAVATPETEGQWLEYCRTHQTKDVARKVALSPQSWKRYQALHSSLGSSPIASAEQVAAILDGSWDWDWNLPEGPRAARMSRDLWGPESYAADVAVKAVGVADGATDGAKGSASCGATSHEQRAAKKHEPSGVEVQAGPESRPFGLPVAGPVGPGDAQVSCAAFVVGAGRGEGSSDPPAGGGAASGAGCGFGAACGGGGGGGVASGAGVAAGPVEDVQQCPDSPVLAQAGLPHLMPAPKIRLTFDLTPDQYAQYERACGRLQAQVGGRRLSRPKILTMMADAVLSSGSARSRARHQVVIHRDINLQAAWYDTDRGVFPVDPKLLARILEKGPPPIVVGEDGRVAVPRADMPGSGEAVPSELDPASMRCRPEDATASPVVPKAGLAVTGPLVKDGVCEEHPSRACRASEAAEPGGRKEVPNGLKRALFAAANHCCARCGGCQGPLHLHHKTPVSEGGRNSLETLEVLCQGCHNLEHEKDFAGKPSWSRAREAAREAARWRAWKRAQDADRKGDALASAQPEAARRAAGEGAAGEGAAGEGTAGEGAAGEGTAGEGAAEAPGPEAHRESASEPARTRASPP
jgi:5-methylcytosine-specific restriction endonuclease McrA